MNLFMASITRMLRNVVSQQGKSEFLTTSYTNSRHGTSRGLSAKASLSIETESGPSM